MRLTICACFLVSSLCAASEIDELKAEYVHSVMDESSYSPSRMATPIRKRKSKIPEDQIFKPTKKEKEVQYELNTCLASKAQNSYYDSLDCYTAALNDFRYNSTWLKRAGTLHMLTDTPPKAAHYFNESVSMLFGLARYKTKSAELLENGGVRFLQLFSHRDPSGSLEAAKLMAFNASYVRRTEDALHLYNYLISRDGSDLQVLWEYTDFLMSNGLWENVTDVLGKIPLLDHEYRGMPPLLLAIKMLQDAIPSVGRRLLSVGTSNATKVDLAASRAFIRTACGVSDLLPDVAYPVAVLSEFTFDCFGHRLKKKGKLYESFGDQGGALTADRIGFMQYTPLHVVAMIGGNEVILQQLLSAGVKVGTINRFGQTALHLALGNGHFGTAKKLLLSGASLGDKDSSQKTPVEYACAQASWIDRTKLAALLDECTSEDPCDIEEDDIVVHAKGKVRKDQGGWEKLPSEALDTVPELHAKPYQLQGMRRDCMIDVVDGSIEGLDLLTKHILKGKPVLLKGGVTNKQAGAFKKEKLLQVLSGLRGKVEAFPQADLYGSKTPSTVMTLGEFVAGSGERWPRTFVEKLPRFDKKVLAQSAAEEVIPGRHPLQGLVGKLAFPFSRFEGFKLNASEEVYVSVGKPGGGDGAVVSVHTTMHAMPYGLKKWYLHPPAHAFVSNEHPLSAVKTSVKMEAASNEAQAADPLVGRSVLSLEQHPGDVLVVPPMWGSVSVNMRECVTIVKRLDLDSLVPNE
eukprot:TRINITY_DN21267_c0_g1_i1.p1 TRINITY_DN21267_c0_g1~~TRINITY_DN21267_c0_g1_i1.p1  ORF type:complete len:744 (+),score=206.35 TRINITY_DN21267_c0_g1_i1:35-2266(+)